MNKCFLAPVLAGLCGFAALLPSAPALAQGGAFPVHNKDFSLWCTEQMHYSYDRCEKRDPKDIKAFEDYSHLIEKYEMKDILNKRHSLSIANIKNAADSNSPGTSTEGSAPEN